MRYNRVMVLRDPQTKLFIGAGIIAIAICLMLSTGHVDAAGFNLGLSEGANAARGKDQVTDLFGTTGTFRTLTNVMLFLIGAISVIMLIIGGLRYVLSGGDSTQVTNAKNTILYAVVGIIIAILAYAIVSFVITSFSGSAGGGTSIAPTNI